MASLERATRALAAVDRGAAAWYAANALAERGVQSQERASSFAKIINDAAAESEDDDHGASQSMLEFTRLVNSM